MFPAGRRRACRLIPSGPGGVEPPSKAMDRALRDPPPHSSDVQTINASPEFRMQPKTHTFGPAERRRRGSPVFIRKAAFSPPALPARSHPCGTGSRFGQSRRQSERLPVRKRSISRILAKNDRFRVGRLSIPETRHFRPDTTSQPGPTRLALSPNASQKGN